VASCALVLVWSWLVHGGGAEELLSIESLVSLEALPQFSKRVV
jgi:hypothetical protein